LEQSGIEALSVARLFSVDGWVAVVTGGGTGLGLITAAALAQNGATVYISGRRLEPLELAAKTAQPTSGKGKIIPVQADASTKEGIAKLRDEVAKHEKWMNVLVNNHGVSMSYPNLDPLGSDAEEWSKAIFEGSDFDAWDETYRINCSSYHFTTFAFLPLLAAAKTIGKAPEPGNVVMISSISGIIYTAQRGQFNYNASKAGVVQLSRNLATEFIRRGLGIRVNCICPGYFPSGMSVNDFHERSGEQQAKHARTRYGIPMARVGNAEDYAQTIFAVVTNKYMTGTELVPDGGWMLEQAY